jgi:hypothetical protein
LPLLIELREYAIAQSANFLEFHLVDEVPMAVEPKAIASAFTVASYLSNVDGLDEVFDHSRQSTVIDDIIRFAQQYPKRGIDHIAYHRYNPDRLKQARFRHFTIQPLNAPGDP